MSTSGIGLTEWIWFNTCVALWGLFTPAYVASAGLAAWATGRLPYVHHSSTALFMP